MNFRLENIKGRENRFRFYAVSVEKNLFGDHSIIIHWGRIGHPGRVEVRATGCLDDIKAKAGDIYLHKIARGYADVDTM